MIARVAVWEPMPDEDRSWVVDAAMTVSGVTAAYHLVDPKTGNGLSVSIFETEEAMAAAHQAIERRAKEIGWYDQPRPGPTSSTVYNVLRNG